MVQQGQVFELTRRDRSGQPLWAYRYRIGGRGSRRVQRGGFACEQDARDALERELDRARRERRISRSLTLAELVETYLAQHDVQPVTIEKLRYLLSKATAMFGDRRIGELTSQEIAAWRMRLSPGYRFEATQALRQVLHRAVAWGMIDVNPAKVGVDNPVRRRKEQHPFESWAELEALADELGPRYGPMILFAAATGLRRAEWIALEKRDVDRKERVVYVRRSFTKGELSSPRRRRACGQGLLGFHSNGAVLTWLPLFLFTVLFGLSMDYHVFILSRVKELVDHGMPTDLAVERGIRTTASTVTSAAAVMIAVFAIFASLRTLDIKQLGVGLAVAVFIDATLIRGVLLPAAMKLLGDWNWYLPRWLEWMPRLTVEPKLGEDVSEAPPIPAA